MYWWKATQLIYVSLHVYSNNNMRQVSGIHWKVIVRKGSVEMFAIPFPSSVAVNMAAQQQQRQGCRLEWYFTPPETIIVTFKVVRYDVVAQRRIMQMRDNTKPQ